MKRRQLIALTGAGLLTPLLLEATKSQADAAKHSNSSSQNSLSIQWLGHMCFLFTGGGLRILIDPFRPGGCTAHYRPPKVAADLVLISSQLLDEGETAGLPGNPQLVYEPGVYQFKGIQLQGITIDHDRFGGKRFGTNVAWLWNQAGIRILDLGGAAAAITVEQKILIQHPDVLLLPVGGGPKAYTPEDAKRAVETLNPKLIIPTQYRTQGADPSACDIVTLDKFLNLMKGVPVRRSDTDTVNITPATLPQNGPVIQVLSYKF